MIRSRNELRIWATEVESPTNGSNDKCAFLKIKFLYWCFLEVLLQDLPKSLILHITEESSSRGTYCAVVHDIAFLR